jgi:hypothetical protein
VTNDHHFICRNLLRHSGLLAAAVILGSQVFSMAAASKVQARWKDFINHQATADLSTRGIYSEIQDRLGSEFTIGLDGYGKLSTWNRDIATFVVQIYGGRIENHPFAPPYFGGRDDWDIFAKINTINFHLSNDRRFNIKLGHYEVPYGLEATINSNGTLRQFSHPSNLGLKLDWGATINGTFPLFQYEIGVSRGSGTDYHSTGDPHAIAGRIGTPIDSENFWGSSSVGISFYQADLTRPDGSSQERWRVGVDGQHYLGPFGVLGELSVGETDSETTINTLTELNITNPRETILAYNQLRWVHQRLATGWDDSGSLAFGVRYAPDTHWALSAQFTQELWQLAKVSTDQIFSLQLRYRF